METVVDSNTILDFISDSSCQMIEEINSSSEGFESVLENYKSIIKKLPTISPISDVLNKFNCRLTTINTVKEICEKNDSHLKKLKARKDEFHQKLEKWEQCNIEAQEKVKCLQHKTLSKANQIKMKKKRDKILFYKLLTKTCFCYETKSIKGYVIGKSPENVRCFDLNPKKLSTMEITDSLYATLKKVCEGSTMKIDEEKM